MKEETIYSSVFTPERRYENENYFYYEVIPINTQSNQGECIEKSTYDSNENSKNNFDCLSFMDFSQSEDKNESSSKKSKSLFGSEFMEKPKKLFMTYKTEKKLKQPAMICDHLNCGMTFRHRWIFERHLSSHLTCRFFRCPEKQCHKLYKSKENLNLHTKNIHEGIKPYQCKYCPSRFSHRNGKLKFLILGKTYHERKLHDHYLPHICNVNICRKAFASKSALNYHLINQHN